MRRLINKQDLLVALLLFLFPLCLFFPVTFGSQTLLPVDNLYAFEPWRSAAPGVVEAHNTLLSDLILENYAWKDFIRESISQKQFPLWNPYILSGQPFFANGQQSTLYPLSLIFYLMPLAKAYGWFTLLQLWLAGLCAYILLRVLRVGRPGALVAGLTYELSGFFLVSVVFTMIIAAASWLPLLLAFIELTIRKQEEKGSIRYSPIPYIVGGALTLGIQCLAGHVEITYYALLVSAFYALLRLIVLHRRLRAPRLCLRLAAWLLAMVVLGLGLGAVQFVPLYEVATQNFRSGSVGLAEVRGWALPLRRAITFFIPNFFGSPAHHGYWDVITHSWQPIGLNFHGEINPLCPGCVRWDVKTSVEAGAYAGLLPLALALLAVYSGLKRLWLQSRRRSPEETRTPSWGAITAIFALLALLSLLFAFGTPLYALLFYGVPGWNQLHSPFRWIYPFTLSIAVLAGIGIQQLGRVAADERNELQKPALWLGRGLAACGLAGLLLSAGILALPAPFVNLAQRLVERSGLAQNAFAGGRAFLGYEFPNLLHFALALLAAGIVLMLAQYPTQIAARWGNLPLWQALAVLVVGIDLLAGGWDFNPAADPALLNRVPSVISFLQEKQIADPYFRITSFDTPSGRGNKLLPANSAMPYRLYDVRGYDSIIPAHYARFMQTIQQNGDLLYNQVGPLYYDGYASLDSALLDLLGVRYVLTTVDINNPGYRLVYDKEVRVYENLNALPRAFLVPEAETAPADIWEALKSLNPGQIVLLDGEKSGPEQEPLLTSDYTGGFSKAQAQIISYEPNEVRLKTVLPDAGWLLLADTYFTGWKAYVSPSYAQVPAKEIEKETPIYRADGAFRAVHLPPGAWDVRFVYSPMSFKLGLYVTFLSAMILAFLAGYWAWGKIYREEEGDASIKRILKNSLAPMLMALTNRLIDFAFALLMLRILSPEGAGRYQFAVVFIGYAEIFSRFGMGTLLTREVARDHSRGNRFLSNVMGLRLLLWLGSLPIMAIVLSFYVAFGGVSQETVIAIACFAIGLFFSNVADALTSLFYAYEKAEYPAAIATITTLTRVGLGALALLFGWGVIGLAAVSVIANLTSVGVMIAILYQKIFHPYLDIRAREWGGMVDESLPLMINHLLSTVFFRIDILILQPTWGDKAVGFYGAAYKYIDGINIIPSYFTLAIFPLMSRYAAEGVQSLRRAYILSLRLLMLLALPITIGTPFIARELILLLGGGAYLPDSMIALQLLIGFLPFSFVNQVTQYVLIAINQQRFLTKAFLIGVAFNLGANLWLIPQYGYRAAAVTTILSEWALLIPFYYAVRRHLGPVPWIDILWKPALSAALMGAVLWAARGTNVFVMVIMAAAVYGFSLLLLKGFSQPDMEIIWRALPAGRFGRLFAGTAGKGQLPGENN